MQAVVRLSGLSVFLRLAAVAVTIVAGGLVHPARAQESKAGAAPAAMFGWRYEKAANDVHFLHCEMAYCVPGSKVSYRFYPAGTTMPFAQYRSEQELVVKALQERAPPGTKITIVAIESDDIATLPRMYRTQRLTIHPDGSQEHVHSGILMDEQASVSLISSSSDEKAATANYARYAQGLMWVIQGSRDQKK